MTPEDYMHKVADNLGTDLDGLESVLATHEGRVTLTKYDPLLFALVYMYNHLQDQQTSRVTLSEFHVAVAEYGLEWVKQNIGPLECRDAFIAPRGVGKSTWIFTILPMWAAAHGHIKFLVAFSDASDQAEGHLATFKSELENNEALMNDFPDMSPLKRGNRAIAWSANNIALTNGFTFDARGIDTNSLGKKATRYRPDLIILDDIEKGEKNYSEYQAGQQKNTVIDDIAPMNLNARMVFVGTTTMPNSVMDQFRKYAEEYDDQELKWIADEKIRVHYYPAILSDEAGVERSIWPEKWSLDFLNSRRHTRSFAKNYMNKPMATDGQLWQSEDVVIDRDQTEFGNTILSIDPAVTKNALSDYTGLAVLSRAESEDGKSRIYVRHAEQFKGSPEGLRDRVQTLVEIYDVGAIYVEVNQGGDLWRSVFKDVDAKYVSKHQKISKNIRAGKALNFYQKDKVRHSELFPILEEQMYSFPKVKHDDVLDAVVSGVLFFLDNKAIPVKARQLNYMGGY